MKKNRNIISRKDAIRRISGLAIGLPLISTSFGKTLGSSFFLKDTDSLDKYPPLFPFQISHESPDNVTNFNHLLDKPAGKRGFIRVKNGRFINNAGIIRLNGTNLTGPANFPSHYDAKRLARRLARFGINCVRLHYMDADYGNFLQEQEQGLIAKDANTQRNIDVEQLDRLDYLISVFKESGIYVDMNLHVARWWDERDGFFHQDQRPSFDKGLDNFEPRMIELQKEYARKLLTHVNPYTSLPYTDEPSVAVIELNNENSLFAQYLRGNIDKLPDPYASEFRKQWNAWLKNKYKNSEKLIEVWHANLPKQENKNGKNEAKLNNILNNANRIEDYSIPTIKKGSEVPTVVKQDFYQFLIDTEDRYWTGMYRFLKDDLKVKSLVSGTQVIYRTSPFVQAKLDYIDSHTYWCHPGPVSPDWRIVNKPMVNSMSQITLLASSRIIGKPFTVSEYNHPFPNQFGAEGQPMLRAYGRFQGWDGVFEYTYNDRTSFDPSFNNYFFSMIERTDVLAHFPACSAIFLRGDVQEGKSAITGSIDYNKYFDHLIETDKIRGDIETAGFDMKLSLIHKTAVDLSGQTAIKEEDISKINQEVKGKNILVSDTGELVWNIEDPQAGYFTVNTLNCKLFSGFPKGRKIKLGNISLSIGNTRLGWATISIVSKKGNRFGANGKPDNILLTATGIIKNNGMTIIEEPNEKIKLSDWGKSPVYAEGIPATISLPIKPNRIKCFSLDIGGNRMGEIPIDKRDRKYTEIIIKPDYKTVWYEILIN